MNKIPFANIFQTKFTKYNYIFKTLKHYSMNAFFRFGINSKF